MLFITFASIMKYSKKYILSALLFVSLLTFGQNNSVRTIPVGIIDRAIKVDSAFIENAFEILPIDSILMTRIYGKSYKSNCVLDISNLRYLRVLHKNLDGDNCIGEIVCHKDIAVDLMEIFQALYKDSYPIEQMRLIDDFGADDEESMKVNNTSCFNFRFVGGTSKLSNHSMGRAIDINPLYNPYVKVKNGVTYCSPENGKSYIKRDKKIPYKIDRNSQCYKEFIKRGFIWGGDWKSVKDYQHFEKP